MYGYIYKTTNKINNKIYIGQKKSDVFLAEKYLGSGVRLKSAIKYYGKENFSVELVDTADSLEKLNEKEIYYISYYSSTNPEIGYNISFGGGGISGIVAWNSGLTKETDSRLIQSDETKQKRSESLKVAYAENRHPKNKPGYKHSHAQSDSVRKANSERQIGKRWMYYGEESDPKIVTTVFRDDIEYYLSIGYKFGRPNFSAIAWNKGLTKETDERVSKYSEHRREQLKTRCIGFCRPKSVTNPIHRDTST